MLRHFAALDHANYGDLLYTIVLEKMLQARVDKFSLERVSLIGGKAPLDAGYESTSIRKLFSSNSNQPFSLIIGGGDVLRTDWKRVASYYEVVYGSQIKDLPVFRLESFIRKILRRKPPVMQWFKAREMNYSAPGPWIIDSTSLPFVEGLAYCSCGVPFNFPKEDYTKVKDAFDHASYIYVRDQKSREKLLEIGVNQKVYAAPDLIYVLSDFFDYEEEFRKGRDLLKKWNVDIEGEILCFQSTVQSDDNTKEIIHQLKLYKKRTKSEVILMPIGYSHYDDVFLKKMARESEGALNYVGINSIFDMISVIAASNTFLGTSMHGNITSFSFGIPHLLAPIKGSKFEGFLDMAKLPHEVFWLQSWSQTNSFLDEVRSLEKAFFTKRLVDIKDNINDVFDEMLKSLSYTFSEDLNMCSDSISRKYSIFRYLN